MSLALVRWRLSIPLMSPMPIIALCGFLGSGKTTLLRRWRRDEALRDAAVIVHDLSEFGLDAELLSQRDVSLLAFSQRDSRAHEANACNSYVRAVDGFVLCSRPARRAWRLEQAQN